MLKRVSTALLAAAAVWLSGAENLLKNPSFENGTEGWENPSWLKNLIVPKRDRTVSFKGKASLKFSGRPGKVVCFHQKINLPAGTKEVTFASRIKTSGLPRGWMAAIHLTFYGGPEGKQLKEYIRGTDWQKPENDWLLCGDCVPVPEGTTKAFIALRMYHAHDRKGEPDNLGCAWFDDLQLYAGNVPEVLPKKDEAATGNPGPEIRAQ